MGTKLLVEFPNLTAQTPTVDLRIEGPLGDNFYHHLDAYRAALNCIVPSPGTRARTLEALDKVKRDNDLSDKVRTIKP